MIWHLTVEAAPRTKKNHGKVIKRGGRKLHVQSDAQKKWADSAIWQLRNQWRRVELLGPVQVSARVFRQANTGDLVGYLQAIGDALERAKVIGNDRQIVSWDGSRLLKDADHPRVELDIEVLAQEAA